MSFHFSGHTVVVYHCVAQFSIKTCAGNFKTKEDKFSADEAMKQLGECSGFNLSGMDERD